ncbi:hypothetical protein SDC9_133901 [bioreactor metagenome]|uniref:Uncharacterized protein n=1 Tax=bioreactor metagenome TaxID=1076179 RepID=A0A645DC69_9ZZZZ
MILYLKQDALVRKYIEDNFDALVTKYQPKMVKMLQTSSQADAEAALAEIKAGADFAETTTKYGNGNYTGAEQLVYNTSTDVNSAVLTAINSYTAAGLMDAVVVNDEGTLYNVIEITSVDATAFKDTFIDTFASDDTMNSTALAYYVRKGNFTVYDEDVYNALSDSNPEYLDQ